jgi:hypothetical protein
MASAELRRRVEKMVGYPPLSEMSDKQRREVHEALLDADGFEDTCLVSGDGDPRGPAQPAEAARRHLATNRG